MGLYVPRSETNLMINFYFWVDVILILDPSITSPKKITCEFLPNGF